MRPARLFVALAAMVACWCLQPPQAAFANHLTREGQTTTSTDLRPDTTYGGGGVDIVHALPGNDTILTYDGDDIICGHDDSDSMNTGPDGAHLHGGRATAPPRAKGRDELYGELGNDFALRRLCGRLRPRRAGQRQLVHVRRRFCRQRRLSSLEHSYGPLTAYC